MKDIHLILLLVTVILIEPFMHWGCEKRKIIDRDYPQKVIKLGVEKEFDQAKWTMYQFYSQCRTDHLVKTPKGSIDTLQPDVSFLTFELSMTHVEKRRDTLVFNFFFLPKEGFFTSDPTCQGLNGIGFVGKGDEIQFYDFGDNWMRLTRAQFLMEFDEKKIIKVFEKTLKQEYNNLAPWLLKEARKRKLLK